MLNTIYTFEDGLRLAHRELKGIRSVSIGVFTGVGSGNETAENNGISHFVEHMMFKGTPKRTAYDIVCQTDGLGAMINAFTAKQLTCYYTVSVDEYADNCMEILSDIYFNSLFDKEEMEKEKGVVLEEISMSEDEPIDLCLENATSAYFKGSPLGMTILGERENIKAFTPEKIRAYVDEHYCADNSVISIVGNISFEKAKALTEQYFAGKYKRRHASVWADKPHVTSPISAVRIKDIEQANLGMVFPSVEFNNPLDTATMLVNTIFGGGMSSRLFQDIREKQGLAYNVSSYPSNYVNNGNLTIYAGTNINSACKATQSIRKEIMNLKKDGLSAEEIERGKKQLKGSYILGQENAQSLMKLYAKYALLANTPFDFDAKIAAIDKVDEAQVRAVIDGIFDMDKVSTSYVGKEISCDLLEIMRG